MVKPIFRDEPKKEEEYKEETTVSRLPKETVDTNNYRDTTNLITREQAEDMAIKAAEMATEKALKRRDENRREIAKEDNEDAPIVSSKTVKDLQNIASIFNSLKEFSANPLQKAIEGKVGDVAAGVVERAFSPKQEPQKRDLIDQILNSNFASGLGAGLGQRGPELVDTFTKNFGKEKVDGWISGAVSGHGMGSMGQPKQQSEMEMVLSLDRNNPEHVAAYAKSQGDMTMETARKVLGIHQDDFINQLDMRGMDTTQYRGRQNAVKMRRNQNTESQNIGSNISDAYPYGGNVENAQEYTPHPRVSDDLIKNTPKDIDNRDDEDRIDNRDTVVEQPLETQNIDLHPEMERVYPKDDNPNIINPEIINYLKILTEQISGLKEELDILKKERLDGSMRDEASKVDRIFDGIDYDNTKINEKIEEEKGKDSEEEKRETTTVRSMKRIKFSNVK